MRTAAALVVLALLVAFRAMASEAPPGAASCSGCHGGTATAIPAIAGRDAGELAAALEGFRSGERPATVMTRIAKGFSPDELREIAAWVATQR